MFKINSFFFFKNSYITVFHIAIPLTPIGEMQILLILKNNRNHVPNRVTRFNRSYVSVTVIILNFFTDHRTRGWPLVDSPMPTILYTFLYLIIVWAGPRLMKNREPFHLTWLLIPYNLSMAILNLYIASEVSTLFILLASRLRTFNQTICRNIVKGELNQSYKDNYVAN